MSKHLRICLLAAGVWVAAAFVFAASAPAAAATSRLATKPCSVGASKAPGICGTLLVFEDRTAKAGRTIPLHFILIKAKHASHHAVAFNPGGPGASATDDAALFADDAGPFKALRDRNDILLVDNRGTGGSAPQRCDFAPPAHPELYFMQLWPDGFVKTCRARLAAHANLNLYSTSVAADDLDDVRDALGFEKLALFGGSYGTRFYLVYARRHPDRVESIVLDGVAPPHFYILPLPMAAGAQMAIRNLIAACNVDAACTKRFPAFGEHFSRLVRRFDAGPVLVPLQNQIAHRTRSVRLSKEVFAETVRHSLYAPGDAAYIPVVVERAFHGDYAPLASLVDQMSQQFANAESTGLNLSVTCAEDIPFITETDVLRSRANSFEGDARVRAQQRACRIWNVRPAPRTFIDPVKSGLPILMISGTNDPATPPSYAKQALRFLPNARIMAVKGASHNSDYPPCVYRTMASFIGARSASHLDLQHCAATYRRAPFATMTYFDSVPGENAARTARFRKVLMEILQGRIDRTQLTPTVSKAYSEAVLRQIASEISPLGTLESFVYRGAHRSQKGTAYGYLSHFVQANASVTITLSPTGKIADISISPA